MRNWLGPLAFGLILAAATAWAAIGAIPYGLMNVAMERLGQGGVNTMSYGNLANPNRQPVVRPSPDLAYSSCPYDLTAGPLAIDVAPVPGRYSSLSIVDVATDVSFVRNDVEAGGKPVALGYELNTIAHNPFDGTLAGPYTAHPHHDPFTDEVHSIAYRGDEPNKVWHVVLDKDAHVVREEAIAVSDGPSIHDCAITQNYVLVFDLPVTFSLKMLLAGYRFPYAWNNDHPARVGLLPRDGSGDSIIWVPVEPCYVFHPANSHETADGKVVVDVVAHETMFAESKRGPDSQKSRMERWTIDPVAGTTTRTVIHDHAQEFPRYDERLTSRAYRYIYSVAMPDGESLEWAMADTRLFKHDLAQGSTAIHDFGPGRHPGEFVFVPRRADSGEDDGWLIGLVVNMNDQTTALVILNADDFTGSPQAVVNLPHRVPPGFHGNWVAD